MRASRQQLRALRALLPEHTAVCQQGPQCSSPGGALQPALTWAHDARPLSTSTPACSFEGFARVVRQPVPKSSVLNRDTYKAWCSSNLDIGMAARLIQLQLQRGNPSSEEIHKRAHQLLLEAHSWGDLRQFVEDCGPHVAPGLLAKACAQAANKLQVSTTIPTAQPPLDPREAWPVLQASLQHLEPQLSKLSLPDFSALLYALSRTHYPLPERSKQQLHQELTAVASSSPGDLQAKTASSIMLSLASLGMHNQGNGSLWQQLSKAVASAGKDGLDAGQMGQAIQALHRSGDTHNQLWGKLAKRIMSCMKPWLATQPEQVAALLHQVARSGNQLAMQRLGPNPLRTLQARLKPASLQLLTPRALVHLAHFCAASIRQPGSRGNAQEFMDHVCSAIVQRVTRLSSHDLQSLASALSLAGRQADPLVHVCADMLRIRSYAGLGPVPASAILSNLADLHYPGQRLCRGVLPQVLKAIPSLPPSSLAHLMWAYARMAQPSDAHAVMHTAGARLLDGWPGMELPPAVLARACIACHTLQQQQQQQQQQQGGECQAQEQLVSMAALLGKQLHNVEGLGSKLEPELWAQLLAVMPELKSGAEGQGEAGVQTGGSAAASS